jgi:hypothetical protein
MLGLAIPNVACYLHRQSMAEHDCYHIESFNLCGYVPGRRNMLYLQRPSKEIASSNLRLTISSLSSSSGLLYPRLNIAAMTNKIGPCPRRPKL